MKGMFSQEYNTSLKNVKVQAAIEFQNRFEE